MISSNKWHGTSILNSCLLRLPSIKLWQRSTGLFVASSKIQGFGADFIIWDDPLMNNGQEIAITTIISQRQLKAVRDADSWVVDRLQEAVRAVVRSPDFDTILKEAVREAVKEAVKEEIADRIDELVEALV